MTLAVISAPAGATAAQLRGAVITRYPLAFCGLWLQPPVLREVAPLHDPDPAPGSWRQARATLRFNDRTGVMDADTAELRGLLDQLRRAAQPDA